MTILVEIESGAGTKLGVIATVTNWHNVDCLDKAGTFEFQMPSTDPHAALVQEKRIAKCYQVIGGTRSLVGAGVIDMRRVSLKNGQRGVELNVGGDNLLRELANKSVGFLQLTDGSGGGVSTALADIIGYAPAGWSLDTVNGYSSTTNDVYGQFAGELVLNALVKVVENTGEHFRLGVGRKVVWLRSDTPNSGIRAIQGGTEALEDNDNVALIIDLQEEQSSYDLVTRIYPYGAGNGDARLTLKPTSLAAPAGYTYSAANNYISKDSAVSSYGIIERYVSFKNIAPVSNTDADLESAADTLFGAAVEYLGNHSQVQKTYSLKVAKLAKIVYPGETIDVVYRDYVDGYKAIDINETLYILETTTEIDSVGVRVVGMKVSTVCKSSPSDAEIVSEQIGESRIFEAHPQLNANSYVTAYREAMDDDAPAVVDFWLGKEVTTVNQVIFRFRIDPLRSTVKSVAGSSTTTASGGGSTSGSGGSSTPTSSSGGGQTATGGSHGHNLTLHSGAGSANTQYATSGGFAALYGGAGLASDKIIEVGVSSSHDHTISAHTHTVTIPSHTHSTPNHTHTLTPNISTEYGLFEESSVNTLAESNLVYKVNGGADLGADVTSIGGDWYELDITDEVADTTTKRPNQEANQLEISTATADKTALITGQLTVRTVIQAIAVS